VIDETSFRKRGKKSAGVSKQHCGTTGQLENCQVGVFLAYVSRLSHTLIDRELYLPLRWSEDQERCREAGIPKEVRFQTKCEQARQMIERLWKAKIPLSWVVADTVYGGNGDLRTWLEAHQYFYGLAVACDEPVGIRTPEGRKRMTVAEAEALSFHAQDWQRISMSNGTKGPRQFDWAMVPMLHQWEDDGQHFLLVRRCVDDPDEKTYYFVFVPLGTTLVEMVQAIGQRWKIEECFETGKEMGMEDYEVRCYQAWYRHVTLVMLVQACLAGICAAARRLTTEPPQAEGTPPICPLLPLTIPEVRHLLAHLLWRYLAARHCFSPGPGGGVATRVARAFSIRNSGTLPGKAQPPEPFICHSAIQGFFPLSCNASHHCFSQKSPFHNQSFFSGVLSSVRRRSQNAPSVAGTGPDVSACASDRCAHQLLGSRASTRPGSPAWTGSSGFRACSRRCQPDALRDPKRCASCHCSRRRPTSEAHAGRGSGSHVASSTHCSGAPTAPGAGATLAEAGSPALLNQRSPAHTVSTFCTVGASHASVDLPSDGETQQCDPAH
jgi:SRSO17 transposase